MITKLQAIKMKDVECTQGQINEIMSANHPGQWVYKLSTQKLQCLQQKVCKWKTVATVSNNTIRY